MRSNVRNVPANVTRRERSRRGRAYAREKAVEGRRAVRVIMEDRRDVLIRKYTFTVNPHVHSIPCVSNAPPFFDHVHINPLFDIKEIKGSNTISRCFVKQRN